MAIEIAELRSDFRNFLWYLWKWLRLPDPTPLQYEMAEYLQYGPRWQIIEGYRGIGKSWITSAFVVWCLWNDPQGKFLVISASKDRSDAFSTFTKRLIMEVDILAELKPRDDQRFSNISFDVAGALPAHAPSVKSVGIFGQVTGTRATHIIADDVEVPGNSATQDLRSKLLTAVGEFNAIIVPGGRVTFLGTPQSKESIYNKLRKEFGYAARLWPVRFPDLKLIEEYMRFPGGDLSPVIAERLTADASLVGKPTDPTRFDEAELLRRETKYGRTGFALQFMLDTSLSDALRYPLKCMDFIVLDNRGSEQGPTSINYAAGPDQQIGDLRNPGFTGDNWYRPLFISKEWTKWEGCVMAIDPSGKGTDETAYCILRQLHGNLYLPAIGGMQGGYDDATLEALAKKAKEYKVNEIVVEQNYGGGMFAKLLTPWLGRIHPCSIVEVHHGTQKEVRIIDSVEPVLNQHRVVIDPQVIREDIKVLEETESYSFLYQLTNLTRDRGCLKHDDRLDAFAMAVAYWQESMARDSSKATDQWKDRMIDEEIRKFESGMYDSTGMFARTHNKLVSTPFDDGFDYKGRG
jgi:hypothetical protein